LQFVITFDSPAFLTVKWSKYLLKTCLSKTNQLFKTRTDNVQVSHAQGPNISGSHNI